SSHEARMKKRCGSCGVQFIQHGENLDVVRTSRDQENLQPKGSAGESALDPHLSVVCPFPAQPSIQRKARGRYRAHGSKYISVPQATNLIEAVAFAKSIDLPLVAHLTIHWSGTVAFDDHEGAESSRGPSEGFASPWHPYSMGLVPRVQSSHRHCAL